MGDPHGRVLALDLGKRRIGLAVSDELGLTAQGLPTLERTNKAQDLEVLARLIREKNAALVVVGHPLHLSGAEGRQANWAAQFARTLAMHAEVEVRLWDERLTSVEAGRILSQSGMSRKKKSAAVDRLSAVLILQSYLDYSAGQAALDSRTSPAQ
jgi:putative Holliday junction resolvase